MNKFKYEHIEEQYYAIGNNRLFQCDKKVLNKEFLDNIKFPIMIFDTEFLNQSHSRKMDKKSPLYIKNNMAFKKDAVYIIQYAIINNKEEFINNIYSSQIICLSLERYLSNFNWDVQYHKLKEQFVNICIENNVKTFFCSGGSSDFKILKEWIYDLIPFEEIIKLPFIKSFDEENFEINNYDVYTMMEKIFLFENKDTDGKEYIDINKINKNMREKEMVKFSSFAKLFEWAGSDWNFPFKDEKEHKIYDLCVSIFPYYSFIGNYRFSDEEYSKFKNILNIAIDHCWNDVYKILIFLDFCYSF